MGEPVADVFRIGQQQLLIGSHGLLFGFGGTHQPVLHRSFSVLTNEAMGRIEGSSSTLGHVGDAGTADAAHLGFRGIEELYTVEQN